MALAIQKKLTAFIVAVFAAAFLALPAAAFADTTITQDDVDAAGGVYEIKASGTYVVGEDITGAIEVFTDGDDPLDDITLNLNEHTITTLPDSSASTVYVGRGAQSVTIKNGSLVQNDSDNAALRVEYFFAQVNLEKVSAQATNHCVIDAEGRAINIKSGSVCKVINTDESNEPVLRASSNGSINIYGGEFLNSGGSKLAADDSGSKPNYITVHGGTFSCFPNIDYADGVTVICDSEGTYTAGKDEDLRNKARYVVKVKNKPYVVYFETEDKAKAFADDKGSSVEDAWFTVTFVDEDGKTKLAESQTVFNGEYAEKPQNPSKANYKFDYWNLAGCEYDFGETVSQDLELQAVWHEIAAPVAAIDGANYETLQDAIDAAKDGDEIKLLSDVTEDAKVSGKKIMLNLNDKTLSSAKGSALTIKDGATVSLKNGSIKSENSPAIVVDNSALTIDELNVDAQGSDIWLSPNAISATDSSLVINSGKFTSEGDNSVDCSGKIDVTINGGTFSTTFNIDDDASGSVVINNGYFDEFYYNPATDVLSVKGGSYSDIQVAFALVEGKALVETEDNRYEVMDLAEAKAKANWVVYTKGEFEDVPLNGKVYFINKATAEEFCKACLAEGFEASAKQIYKLSFISKGETVEVRGLEEDEAVGELPAGEEVTNYTFIGWYLNGNYNEDYKLTAETVLEGDSKAVALWQRVNSDETTDDPIIIEDGDDSNGSSSSDKSGNVSPETGDAGFAAVAALAVLAALAAVVATLRRRKTNR